MKFKYQVQDHSIKLKSYAKLNLSLLVFKANKQNYHPICSVFQEISLSDHISITVITKKECILKCNHPEFPLDQRNLLQQVYSKMKHKIKYGLIIKIKKNIPIGGGLGGGSSNAACLIMFINSFFQLNYSDQKLYGIGKSIGADIPFFLKGGTQLVRGIGQKTSTLKTKKNQYYVLIIPPINISTKTIFNLYDKEKNLLLPTKTPKKILKSYLGKNSLKKTVFNFNTTFKELTTQLESYNTPPVYLSGTGSTLFFVVKRWKEAISWEKNLSKIFNDCIIKAVKPIKKIPINL